MDYLDKALFPDFKSLLSLVDQEADGKRYRAVKLAANGNLDAGAVILTEYLKEKTPHDVETRLGELNYRLEHHVNELIVGLFSNAYVLRRRKMPKAAIDLLCAAADLHYEDAAYNAANTLLHESGSPSDIVMAEKYFLQAISDTEDPSKKSAALVNYAEIVRDGRISGKPDYPGAIALYEQAAELGLVTAMFNVGNVAMWMFNEQDHSQAGKGIYWLTRLEEHFALEKPFLNMDLPNLDKGFRESGLDMLMKFHVLSDCPEADAEVGLALLLDQPTTPESAKARQWFTEQAMIKRLKKATKPAQNTPGHNWQYVLSILGWVCYEVTNLPHLHAEFFMVDSPKRGSILFVVMNDVFNPDQLSEHMKIVSKHLQDSEIQRFFIAPSHALFRRHKDRTYTPVLVGNRDALGIGFIGLEGGPDATFASSTKPIDYLTDLSTDSCVISIAINRLNEGFTLQEDLDLGSMFVGFGNWGLPIKNEGSMQNMNII